MEISNCNTQYHTISIIQSFKTENQINLNPRQKYICSKKHTFTAAPTLWKLVDRVR